MTEYRILSDATHRSGGLVHVPLAVGKSGRVVNVPLLERDALALAIALLRAVKVGAR